MSQFIRPKISVQYTCIECGTIDRAVSVDARDERVDMAGWFEHICVPTIIQDHIEHSPGCKPKTLTQIKLPVSDPGQPIGTAPRH